MELSEEEKKAIEWFKSDLEMTKEMGKKWGFQEEIKNNEIILNLVEKQQKEIERLNGIINSRYYHDLKCRELEIEINKNWQDKIKKFIKDELPDDELMECCKIYDVNGIDLRIKLEKLLEE